MKDLSGMYKSCLICEKIFYTRPTEIYSHKYCSHQCYWKSKKGNPEVSYWLSKVRPDFSGDNNPMKRPEVRKKVSDARKGMIFSEAHRKNLSLARQGKNKRENHPNWKGGRVRNGDGYIEIWQETSKYRYEHIIVMEQHLGRPIKKGEIVHHLNGVKDDNRIENLKLFPSIGKHLKYHFATLGK